MISGNNNSTIPRTAISIVGAMNAGKSVLMNLLTQSDVSLVHETAGTTADPKVCAMELHGRIGAVRLLDTPGINEGGELGRFKRERALQTIGQCDVTVVVADPFAPLEESVDSVKDILKHVQRRQAMNQQLARYQLGATGNEKVNEQKKKILATNERSSLLVNHPGGDNRPTITPIPLLIFNLRQEKVKKFEAAGGSVPMLLDEFEKMVLKKLTALRKEKEATNNDTEKECNNGDIIQKQLDVPSFPPTLAVDFTSNNNNQGASRDRVIAFLERHTNPRQDSVSLLPDWLRDTHLEVGSSPTVFLNIPMDQQTPEMRLLRPQAMVQEALIRNFVSTYAYRMDLAMARSENPMNRQREKDRFLRALDPLLTSGNLPLLITDSQAIDIVAPWTLDETTGQELVPITTFSIIMIRYLSGGRLAYFTDGLNKLDQMISEKKKSLVPHKNGERKWRILITEACNHTRLNMEKECADIGTVQIPNHLLSTFGGNKNVEFEYAFGKHVTFDPTRFDLVIHCGGCMLNPQQMDSRVADLMAAGVPATNYGLLLSRIQSPQTLSRVLKPWGIVYDPYERGDNSTGFAENFD